MSNTILIKRSGTANSVPVAGNLVLGELAINYADGNLFYKDSTNAVKVIASNQFLSVVGNVTANNGMFTNIVNVASHTGAVVSVTGNVVSGNVFTGGVVSAAGNITGNYFFGNGSQLTGIDATSIQNGTSNVRVVSSGGNVAVGVGGTGNVAVFATSGEYITGLLSVTGTITGGNVATGGTVSAAGTVTGGNLATGGTASATGTVTGGNLATGGTVSATGTITSATTITGGNLATAGTVSAAGTITSNATITAGNVATGGTISATGNITGGNISTSGSGGNISGANVISGTTLSATGNVEAGNVNAVGLSLSGNVLSQINSTANITTAGNIQGAYILGNISGATGVITSKIFNGTSEANIGASGGNANISIGGTSNVVVFATSGEYVTGVVSATGTVTGGNVATAGTISATGNITGGNVNTTSVTGTAVSVTGNVTANNIAATTIVSAASLTGTIVSVTGNVTGGNLNATALSLSGNVISPLNVTGNITGANVTATTLTSSTTISASGTVTGGNVSAVANVVAGNVNTPTLSTASGGLTIATAGNNQTITFGTTGNIIFGGSYLNNIGAPQQATDAATKQYVDDSVSAGLTIHTPVYVESPYTAGSLNATYADGGTTQIVDSISGNKTLTFTSSPALNVNDVIVFATTTNGLTAGTAYFVYSTNGSNQVTLSLAFDGTEITSLVNGGPGLAISSLANSGVGATLTNAGANAALVIDGLLMTVGRRVLVYHQTNGFENGVYTVTTVGAPDSPGPGVAWVMTRATDANTYGPKSTGQLDAGDYFFVQAGNTGAGESYVLTSPTGVIIFGTTNIAFTQFSDSVVYTANTSAGLSLTGTVFSAKVDNDTTAFDGTGNIIVKASANLTTPNIGAATGASLSVTGNIQGGNVVTGGLISATGTITSTANITGGNVLTGGLISSAGTVTGGNLATGGTASATGTVTGGNIATGGTASATGNITGGNVLTGGLISATGNITGGNANIGGNLNVTSSLTVSQNGAYGNVVTTPFASVFATGAGANPYSIMQVRSNDGISGMGMQAYANINGLLYSNTGITIQTGATLRDKDYATSGVTRVIIDSTGLTANGIVSASGNVTGGNVLTGGLISSTGTITGSSILGSVVSVSGNITGGNISSTGLITTTGNIAGGNILSDNYFYANGTPFDTQQPAGANTQIQYNDGAGGFGASANLTYDNSTQIFSVNGNVIGSRLSATGNVIANNVVATTIVSAASHTGAIVSVTGNVTGGNITTAGTANISTITITTAGNVTATTASTGTTSGAFVIAGGLGVAGNVYGGALYDNGTAVLTINSTVDGGTY